jgi:hypothetical protein
MRSKAGRAPEPIAPQPATVANDSPAHYTANYEVDTHLPSQEAHNATEI